MKHIWEVHTNCQDIHCNICEGGLAHCVVCNSAECELTTDCVGKLLTESLKHQICKGLLDYKNGKWIEKQLGVARVIPLT